MHHLHFIMLLPVLLFLSSTRDHAQAAIPQDEADALGEFIVGVAFKNTTSVTRNNACGGPWQAFVVCNSDSSRIVKLIFENLRLTGTLPSSTSRIPNLQKHSVCLI